MIDKISLVTLLTKFLWAEIDSVSQGLVIVSEKVCGKIAKMWETKWKGES